jgi:hypothetical protein
MISGFRREVDGNCALLGYYTAYSGNFLPTFRDNLSVRSRIDMLFRNVGKKLPQLAAKKLKTAEFSTQTNSCSADQLFIHIV